MLHDVALHDAIGGHQAYIYREIFYIWLIPRAVHVIHVRFARISDFEGGLRFWVLGLRSSFSTHQDLKIKSPGIEGTRYWPQL